MSSDIEPILSEIEQRKHILFSSVSSAYLWVKYKKTSMQKL